MGNIVFLLGKANDENVNPESSNIIVKYSYGSFLIRIKLPVFRHLLFTNPNSSSFRVLTTWLPAVAYFLSSAAAIKHKTFNVPVAAICLMHISGDRDCVKTRMKMTYTREKARFCHISSHLSWKIDFCQRSAHDCRGKQKRRIRNQRSRTNGFRECKGPSSGSVAGLTAWPQQVATPSTV